eukprot:NODE_43_length_33755_cov_1.178542.p24 type:complete len:199 gc:universal NODE_43_length_33755_cov_1.178542:26130-26726(+)
MVLQSILATMVSWICSIFLTTLLGSAPTLMRKVTCIYLDYSDYFQTHYNNDSLPYSVLVPEAPSAQVPSVIMNTKNTQICLSSTVCANISTSCLYYPSSFKNATVNNTHYIYQSNLRSFNQSVSLKCQNTTDLSGDIINYNPNLYKIQQSITKCCNPEILKPNPVVKENDETKFKEKSNGAYNVFLSVGAILFVFLIY